MSVPNFGSAVTVQHAARVVADSRQGSARRRARRRTTARVGGPRRRPSKAQEAAQWRVAAALVAVEGQRASTPQSWLEAVAQHPEVVVLRRDRRTTIERIARLVAGASERESMLVRRLTWEAIGEACECSRATVARTLQLLHRAGLLGRVAPGRSASSQWRPRAGADDGSAETAVYVLAVPAAPGVVEGGRGVDSVDGTETPPHPPVSRSTPARAGACDASARGAAEAIRALVAGGKRLVGAVDSMLCDQLPAWDRDPFWGMDDSPRTAAERLAAAAELRRRAPVLRRISARAVRSVARPFFDAGWTVRDLLEAVDRRPGGTPAPHSGAHGVRCPRRWFAARLRAWTTIDRTPMTAPSERRRLRRAALLASTARDRHERQAARERAAARPRTAATRQLILEARAAARAAAQTLRHPLPQHA